MDKNASLVYSKMSYCKSEKGITCAVLVLIFASVLFKLIFASLGISIIFFLQTIPVFHHQTLHHSKKFRPNKKLPPLHQLDSVCNCQGKVYPLFGDSKIVQQCQAACKGSKISAFPVIYRVIGLSPVSAMI